MAFPASSSSKPQLPQPPPKRSRKAVNCQPCRASKLKCDRARPCSSCVLRGTSSLCYPDGHPEGENGVVAPDEARLDPQSEIQKMRRSLSLLEAHFLRSTHQKDHTFDGASPDHGSARLCISRSDSDPEAHNLDDLSAPASFATQSDAGFYAGPTSSATHLMGLQSTSVALSNLHLTDPTVHATSREMMSLVDETADHELINYLPDSHIVDQVLLFYMDQCCTMDLCIQKSTLFAKWESYKNGKARTRLTVALVFCCIASAIQFLPPRDDLFLYLRRDHVDSIAELSDWYYEQCCQALALHLRDSPIPSLDLIELYLSQIFYLGISKNHAEEIWRIRGSATSFAIALGLHRDPSRWNMPHPLAERRRWAWFNVLRVERWHAFMLGRPISINNNHFDTVFPSSMDPYNTDRASARDHLPYVHMFRLMILYGDIMNDLFSVTPVPYENILAHDKSLEQWFNSFPEELKFDVHNIAPVFKEDDIDRRKCGVQSLCFKLAGLHTQLALHRPYSSNVGTQAHSKGDQSLHSALNAANNIIQLTTSCRPTYLSNHALTVPGHIHWGVLHLFAAAIFLAFQVVARPNQIDVNPLRDTLTKGVIDLEALRGIPAADKAIVIIHALKPLYQEGNADQDPETSKRNKDRILSMVSRLPFPYLDSFGQTRSHHTVSPPNISHSSIGSKSSNGSSREIPLQGHGMRILSNGVPIMTTQYNTSPQQGLYSRRGPTFPDQTPTAGDEKSWSSAVGIETVDWARLMHDVLPKPDPTKGFSAMTE